MGIKTINVAVVTQDYWTFLKKIESLHGLMQYILEKGGCSPDDVPVSKLDKQTYEKREM